MKSSRGSLVLLALLSMSDSVCAQTTSRAAATKFYQTYLKLNIRGLPDPEEHKQLVLLLERSLGQLIEAARLEQVEFIKEHPDEKPPWIEGDLFSSLFEGAQTFRIVATRVRGRRTEVDVNLEYKEKARKWFDGPIRWFWLAKGASGGFGTSCSRANGSSRAETHSVEPSNPTESTKSHRWRSSTDSQQKKMPGLMS